MGTRGIIGFAANGHLKASYNQFDMYPDGVGKEVLAFARTLAEKSAIASAWDRVSKITLVVEDENPSEEQIKVLTDVGYEAQNVSTGADWYAWLRQDQGNPERLASAPFMLDSAAFAADSLFCEYGYVIDLDAETFEAYVGFQTEEHSEGRFAKLNKVHSDYVPIRLVKSWPLSKLPTDEELVAAYGEEE